MTLLTSNCRLYKCLWLSQVGPCSMLCHNKYNPTINSGEDWRHARENADVTTSRLHILKPAGLELIIQRSILQKDALLPR